MVILGGSFPPLSVNHQPSNKVPFTFLSCFRKLDGSSLPLWGIVQPNTPYRFRAGMTTQTEPRRLTGDHHVSLDLADLYSQLQREAATNSRPPPILSVPAVSTRSEVSHSVAQGLLNDRTPVTLATKEERIAARNHKVNLATAAKYLHSTTKEPKDWRENTRPIIVDPDVSRPVPPERSSPETSSRIARLAREAKENGTLGLKPYPTILSALHFETYLPNVLAGLTLEALDADASLENAVYKIDSAECLWDTGSHHTTITSDLLPEAFLKIIHEPEYLEIYGSEDGISVQAGIEIRCSNAKAIVHSLCVVRSEGLPNGFSGVILGQHGFLDMMGYHMVPRAILETRGIDVGNGWGQIQILGHIDQGEYI